MLHVIARIELVEGMQDKFLAILQENIPIVRAEEGCIRYEPCLDIDPETPSSKSGSMRLTSRSILPPIIWRAIVMPSPI